MFFLIEQIILKRQKETKINPVALVGSEPLISMPTGWRAAFRCIAVMSFVAPMRLISWQR